jgi:hypothetical protein
MKSGRKIPYESVLNHRIRKMELEPENCYEGVLLAWSIWTRISTDYLHGETFPMDIALIDQFGRSHLSVIEVRVDRSATIRMPDFTKTGTGLYGGSSSQARAAVGREDPRMPSDNLRSLLTSMLFQEDCHRTKRVAQELRRDVRRF